MKHDDLLEQQLQREKQSASAGYTKYLKQQQHNKVTSNGSNTDFALEIKRYLFADVIKRVEQTVSKVVGYNASDVARILNNCLKPMPDGTYESFFSIEDAAFLGLQMTLDTALNPNKIKSTVGSKYGGDKRLLAKKSLSELERQVGSLIHKQMMLRYIEAIFPAWFRKANKECEQGGKDGMRATTAYWETNLFRSIKSFGVYLREQGEDGQAELIENRTMWSSTDMQTIGSLIVKAVIESCSAYIQIRTGSRNGKKSLEVELTERGLEREQQIRDVIREYAFDLLPMLIHPVAITNDSLGGWLVDSLQEPEHNFNGEIELSDKHLEFINRQSRVAFQINPFSYQLLSTLVDSELQLGKFKYTTLQELPSIANELGYGHLYGEEQDIAVNRDPRSKELRQRNKKIISSNKKAVQDGLMAYQVVDKAKSVLDDEQFFMPMKYDFRGRIYSRVPFISFQSNDVGRYLIRFAERTPIDNRTEHWLKVGISNAAGNDKLCWDKRIHWFDKNVDEIVNVGRMLEDGDFTRAYEFLTQDHIEDPFCLAALANEYVKVFVDKTQDYTQCFVCVDASCSGTSIFNAWRRNYHGASKTNVVDTPKPADIYWEVWEQLKTMAPSGTFRASHIKRIEASKLIRKMMKQGYVPAQYASPKQEQLKRLKEFNNNTLTKANQQFKEHELNFILENWEAALDEVSSIKTVISWFKARSREALSKSDVIHFKTCNGSVMTLKYPKTKLARHQVLGYGSTRYRRATHNEILDETNSRALLNAVTANVTHATDAAALCEGLFDFEHPFVAIHDACGCAPGRHLEEAVRRLKDGFVTATQFDVWDSFREQNGLPHTPTTSGPVIGDLTDWDEVRQSKYLYS